MNNSTANSWKGAATPFQPEKQKTRAGSSAVVILPEKPNDSPGNLRRTCVHLGDADRTAIRQIQETLEISSSALVIRLAIRHLAERLGQHCQLADDTRGGNHG